MILSKENNLLFVNPEVCKQWSNRNEFGPECYAPRTNKKVWWVCKVCNHEWKARIAGRCVGSGCPVCSGKIASKENNLLIKNPEICEEWSGKNLFSPESCLPNSHKKVWWVCKNKHEWKAVIGHRNNGSGCPKCLGKVASKENNLLIKNPEICKEWSKNNLSSPINFLPKSHEKVWWICKKGHEWESRIADRHVGSGCPACSGRIASKENNLLLKNPKLCDQWNYDKNLLPPNNFTPNSHEKVWWICKKGHEWQATINSRNNGNGCSKCSKSVSKLSQDWLDKLNIFEREVKISKYKVDGYDPETNTIYEYLGDYWHGNPNIYNPSDLNRNKKIPFSQLYLNTLNRFKRLTELGYKIIYRWESDTEDKIFNGNTI